LTRAYGEDSTVGASMATDDAAVALETGQTGTPARQPSLWRNRDYMLWWTGNGLSMVGTNVSAMAFPLVAMFTTGSVLNAGLIAAAGRIGGLLTLLWGGSLADRHSRKAILALAPAIQALLMCAVVFSLLSGQVNVGLLAAAALLDGLVVGVSYGAVLPALRRIVPREQFAARASQEQGQAMAAQLVGSPLAAFLFAVARWLPFGVDAASFLFASLGAALIRQPLGPDRHPHPDSPSDASGQEHESAAARPRRRSMISDIREGFHVVLSHSFLRYTTAWVAVTNVVGSSFMLLIIALLRSRGASPQAIGVINAGVLAGGILGALLAGQIIKRFRARRIFQIGGWVYVASLAMAAICPQPWQIGAVAAAFTFASVPTVSVWEAYTVSLVPDRLTGRVGAVSAFCSQSLTWIGVVLAGWLADQWGAPTAGLCFGAILIPFAVAAHPAKSLALFDQPLDQIAELR
jgi:MFS family permease